MSIRTSRKQAALGLEQIASLLRAQAWSDDGSPSLSPTQGAVVRMLAGAATGLRASHVAARLGVSPASLSESIKAMEARQWLQRHADPDDGRASRLRLSAKGRRLAARLDDPANGLGSLLETLDEPDLGALLRVTQLLVREAQRRGLATGQRTCLGCRYFQPFATGRSDRPHYCAYVAQAFGDPELRIDCNEHEAAIPAAIEANAARFRQPVPP